MSDQAQLIVVVTTVESSAQADELAGSLINESLAACVHIDGPIRSHYRWQGKLEAEQEYRLQIKSDRRRWNELNQKLAEIHPYDEPEILRFDVDEASPGYAAWVADQTSG